MTEILDVAIIGAGGAGLSTSYHLTRLDVPHVVLERGGVGERWRSERWDSFHLVNPNWAIRLPGFEYSGDDPDGFLSRDETVDYLERYAASFNAPVAVPVSVTSISREGDRYLLDTGERRHVAHNVVVAAGAFGEPYVPPIAVGVSPRVFQVHSSRYSYPDALPPGAVLVVGSAQSGAQIAEDLHLAGRRVFLALSRSGRRPRRYRGRDSSWWNNEMGDFDRKASELASISDGFRGSAHVSGTRGGHDIYLREFARGGMVLLGRVVGVEGERLLMAPDMWENLAFTDEYAQQWRRRVDEFVEARGLDVPPGESLERPELSSYPESDPPQDLDLRREGVGSIIWATGFRFNFDWIRLPVTGAYGFPIQQRGVTQFPGLCFMGLHWMYSSKSAQFIGIGEDAGYIAEHIAARVHGRPHRP